MTNPSPRTPLWRQVAVFLLAVVALTGCLALLVTGDRVTRAAGPVPQEECSEDGCYIPDLTQANEGGK